MQPPPPNQPPYASPPPPGGPPQAPPPRKGFPAWGWALVGCGCLSLLIVPILAAILFPVFAKSRDKAREVSCLSNEKLMGLALMQYAQDNDNLLPSQPNWMDATKPYMGGDERAFHCPTASGQDLSKYGYAFNSSARSQNISKIASPEKVPMVFDSDNLDRNATDAGSSLPSPPRHGDGNNVVFADGSARTVKTGGP